MRAALLIGLGMALGLLAAWSGLTLLGWWLTR